MRVANVGKVGSMELIVMEQLQSALGLEMKQIAFDKPAYGQVRVSNELRQKNLFVSPGGVHSI